MGKSHSSSFAGSPMTRRDFLRSTASAGALIVIAEVPSSIGAARDPGGILIKGRSWFSFV